MHRLDTRLADAGAIGANILAGWTWISDVNAVLQLVLTIVGIIAAVAAARYHIIRTRDIKELDRLKIQNELDRQNKLNAD